MPYIKQYITYDEYVNKYKASNGNLYEGFVIGYGYVYPQSGYIFPPHWNGYESGSAHIPMNETHCMGIWQQMEDRSSDAINESCTPILEELIPKIIRYNPDNTISVNLGDDRIYNFRKECNHNVKISLNSKDNEPIMVTIQFSLTDDLGQIEEKSQTFKLSDADTLLKYTDNVVVEKYELEKIEPWYPSFVEWTNMIIGSGSNATGVKAFTDYNNLFWRQQNGVYRLVKNINNNYLLNRSYALAQVRNATSVFTKTSKVLGVVGVGLTVADALVQGAVKPSHVIGIGLIGAAATGPIGLGIAVVYSIVDLGLMVFTERSLSERIDDAIGYKYDLPWDPLFQDTVQYQLTFPDR